MLLGVVFTLVIAGPATAATTSSSLSAQITSQALGFDNAPVLLEPDEHPAAKPFKAALVEDGIPFTSFAVEDVHREHERLHDLGVRFTQEPTAIGPVTTAVLDDTCGNLIQLAQQDQTEP